MKTKWLTIGLVGLAFLNSNVQQTLAQEPELTHTLEGHTDIVLTIVFASDGKILCSGSQDKSVKTWDVITGKNIATYKSRTSTVV